MPNKIEFNVRLVTKKGVVFSGTFESTFDNAHKDAAKEFPLFTIDTIYPVDHYLRPDWTRYVDELRRKEAEANAASEQSNHRNGRADD